MGSYGYLNAFRRTGADRRAFAGGLGGVMYLVSGVVVLTTLWLLPARVNRGPLAILAVLAISTGIVLPSLPWSRWPRWAPMVLVVLAQVHLALAGQLSPGSVEHYLPLYVLSYLYVGMTLPPRTGVTVAPLSIVSFVVGSGMGVERLVNFVIALPIALTAAEMLSRLLARQERQAGDVVKLLDATKLLASAESVDSAAAVIGRLTTELASADIVTVLVVDPDHRSRFVARMRTETLSKLGKIDIDIDNEPSGIGVAVRAGEIVVVPDAATSPIVSRRYAEATGVGSIAYVPLFDAGTAIGAVVAGWNQAGVRFDGFRAQALELLSAQAGPVLGRLLEHDRLSIEAERDPLTGLFNRRIADRALGRALRGDAVVMIDMDRFKQVNDNLGHAVGDEALREMAACLLRASRDGDTIARFGGEEFAAVLPSAGAAGTASFLQRVRSSWDATEPVTSFSAGFAVVSDGESPMGALERADAALYEAKASGRNRDLAAAPRVGDARYVRARR